MARARNDDPEVLFRDASTGSRAALARLLSLVERGGEPARAVSRLAHPLAGHAATVGITGAPGSGKSTLTNALLNELRRTEEKVAVLAIDPSSPFTGGAILGDRVRMGDHVLDEGVFIRSMATRGHLGGLSLATPESVRLLDALGYPWVVIETVGVGQVEVEIAGTADTRVVVVNPGWGDAVQANKAGLMEIADIFVINKADRPGTTDTRRDLEQMLELAGIVHHPTADAPAPIAEPWRPPIVESVASAGTGVAAMLAEIRAHRTWLVASGELEVRRRARLDEELERVVLARLLERVRSVGGTDLYAEVRSAVADRTLDPWTAAERLLDL